MLGRRVSFYCWLCAECSFFFLFLYQIRAILAEYSGAVLGVLSAVLYGRKSHLWKKVTLIDSPIQVFITYEI